MARFFVGQRVRIVSCEFNPAYIGKETVITAPLQPWINGLTGEPYWCYEVAIDRVFGPRPDQLEPILPEGAQPSEFTTLRDLMDSLEGVRA